MVQARTPGNIASNSMHKTVCAKMQRAGCLSLECDSIGCRSHDSFSTASALHTLAVQLQLCHLNPGPPREILPRGT